MEHPFPSSLGFIRHQLIEVVHNFNYIENWPRRKMTHKMPLKWDRKRRSLGFRTHGLINSLNFQGPLYTWTNIHHNENLGPWNHPKTVLWGNKIPMLQLMGLNLRTMWMWTILRNRNIFVGYKLKKIGSLEPHHVQIIFSEVSCNWIACHGPQFCFNPTSFWWA